MSRRIPKDLRRIVAQRANNRCEYCGLHESDSDLPFHIDHIVSLKHKGQTVEQNLAFCCSACNFSKGSDLGTYLESQQNSLIRFFHPRSDNWEEHFEIQNGFITPKTPVGEATVAIFLFNTPDKVELRRLLTALGRYP